MSPTQSVFQYPSTPVPRRLNLILLGLLLVAVTIIFCGCGGANGGTNRQAVVATASATSEPPSISVAINHAQCSLPVNQALPITATVTGASDTSVTWSVGGVVNGNATLGTITGAGLAVTYTAPATPPLTNPVAISMTSNADATRSASLSVTITPPSEGPTVSVVLTTDDQVSLLKTQPSVTFLPASDGGNTIFVDETQVYQQIEGFGAAFTDSAAYLLNEVATPADRESAMSKLFTRDGNGIGLSFMRNPIGASDMARSQYSFDDMPAGQSDPELTNFSITHDRQDIIPIIHQAKQLNPQLKIVASPWSPPGWMKTTGSMIGGSLRTDMYAPFALYFVKYLQAYAAAGIPIDYITLQNEPIGTPPNYPGMLMDAATQTVVLRDYVLPALAANNIDSRVLIYDHDWTWADYPESVLADPVIMNSDRIAGIAWHGYSGTPGAQNNFGSRGNYETEHSGGVWIADQVKADFEEIPQVMRNGGKTFVKWNLALDENRGPHTGGGSTCTPLVTINSQTGKASYPVDYYTLGHFSKFVSSGASRIYSSNADGLVSVAFANPDNSKALVAYNDSNVTQTFKVQWGAQAFSYTLPALGGATFSWTGAQSGGYTISARSQVQASSFSMASGLETEVTTDTNGGYDVGYADEGDYALYKYIDFGSGVSRVSVRVSSAGTGGTLEFHLDSQGGPVIASVTIPVTGAWQSWTTVSEAVSVGAGVHDVYVVFRGGSNIGNLNWFTFN